jgi:hypothetical protein
MFWFVVAGDVPPGYALGRAVGLPGFRETSLEGGARLERVLSAMVEAAFRVALVKDLNAIRLLPSRKLGPRDRLSLPNPLQRSRPESAGDDFVDRQGVLPYPARYKVLKRVERDLG